MNYCSYTALPSAGQLPPHQMEDVTAGGMQPQTDWGMPDQQPAMSSQQDILAAPSQQSNLSVQHLGPPASHGPAVSYQAPYSEGSQSQISQQEPAGVLHAPVWAPQVGLQAYSHGTALPVDLNLSKALTSRAFL